MARFTLVAVLVFLVGFLINRSLPQSAFAILQELGLLGLVAAAAYYLGRSFGRLKRAVLWKVRNRVLALYAFVGLFPVAILLIMGWISFRLVFGQVSALYLEKEIQVVSALMEDASQRVLTDLYEQGTPNPSRLPESLEAERERFQSLNPGLGNLWLGVFAARGERGGLRLTASFPAGDPGLLTIPIWAQNGMSSLVHDSERLYFRSVTRLATPNRLLLALQMPFDDEVVNYIEAKTSISLIAPSSVSSKKQNPVGLRSLWQGEGGLTTINWMHIASPIDWQTGSAMRVLDPSQSLFAISVPFKRLYYDFYFSQENSLGQSLLAILALLGLAFVMVEGASLLVGLALARSITRAVQNLYAGTLRILEGDFDYRIESKDSDQLAALANAFNGMSGSIARLMTQVSEKERLEKEIEIAREVQTQLFPQRVPSIRGIQLAGQCLPARMVSGDYYDFIPYQNDKIDVVIGDISGKGISAALLMAGLQSAIRTQLIFQATSNGAKKGRISHSVAEINQLLYAQTAADKFATLVYSRYDADTLRLSYCNAGHNPPFLVSNGSIRTLTAGGMALGLFEERLYEEESVQLSPGDLVVFYTDGVVEAENARGDQFGEERLIQLVSQDVFLTADDIQKLILDEVRAFSHGDDQRDDITVVVLKVEGPEGEQDRKGSPSA